MFKLFNLKAILTHRGRGMSKKDLDEKFIWLRGLILKRGGKVAQPATVGETTSHLVDVSLGVLGSLIGRQKNVLEQVKIEMLQTFFVFFYKTKYP